MKGGMGGGTGGVARGSTLQPRDLAYLTGSWAVVMNHAPLSQDIDLGVSGCEQVLHLPLMPVPDADSNSKSNASGRGVRGVTNMSQCLVFRPREGQLAVMTQDNMPMPMSMSMPMSVQKKAKAKGNVKGHAKVDGSDRILLEPEPGWMYSRNALNP